MAKLVYSMLTSLDGYTEDEKGAFDWAAPDEEVHAFLNDYSAPIGTYLYGRRMYEMMIYWETAHTLPDQTRVSLDWARHWQGTDKIVYSTTMTEPSSARTRVEPSFDPDAIRRLKHESSRDLAVAGPELAAHAIRAGLVDEYHQFLSPVVVGGGKRFLPDGVRVDLELIEERRFTSGVVLLRYATRR